MRARRITDAAHRLARLSLAGMPQPALGDEPRQRQRESDVIRMLRSLMLLGWVLSAAAPGASAAEYPNAPIRLIVTFAAGGSSDVLARSVAKAMSEGLGQPVVVENRPGAGGHIGAQSVARADPDGYTALFGTNGTLGIGPALYKNLKYDPVNDLAPVGLLHQLPNVLIVHPSVPANSLHELIDYARRRPGELSFASAGVGSASHFAGELLKAAANIEIVHVPYKGGGAAMPDLLAGRVSMMIETIPNALPSARSGMLRALGVTTPVRSSAAPDLPTFAEAGLPDFEVSSWTGLFVPAGTPRAIIERLNAETLRIARDGAYLEQLKTLGTEAAVSTPEALGAFMVKDIANWTVAVQRSGARAE
jgi:tripartite-type tricarboxylate transporter receptor subunit TctC